MYLCGGGNGRFRVCSFRSICTPGRSLRGFLGIFGGVGGIGFLVGCCMIQRMTISIRLRLQSRWMRSRFMDEGKSVKFDTRCIAMNEGNDCLAFRMDSNPPLVKEESRIDEVYGIEWK